MLSFPREDYIGLEAPDNVLKTELHFLHLGLVKQVTKQGRSKVQAKAFSGTTEKYIWDPLHPHYFLCICLLKVWSSDQEHLN